MSGAPKPIDGFERLTFNRQLMDALNGVDLFAEHPAHAEAGDSGSADHVKVIDGAFYDKYIVDRWTGKWLAGNTTWVVAVSRRYDQSEISTNYRLPLVAKTATILNDMYQGNNTIRFGLVDFMQDELLKETLDSFEPRLYILKDGKSYRSAPMMDSYVYQHEFIEVGWHQKPF